MLNNRKSVNFNPFSGIIMTVITLVMIYFIFKGLFALASWIMPVLAIATLFINYHVYLDFGKFIRNLFMDNWVLGIGAVLLSIMLMPFLIVYLFSKALLLKKFDNSKAESFWNTKKNDIPDDEYVDFEEVEDDEAVRIELPPIDPKVKRSEDNSYDEFFK